MLQLSLLVVALVCFVLAALGASVPRVALLPLGFAFWMVALIIHVVSGRPG